jgi:hypothetical protein
VHFITLECFQDQKVQSTLRSSAIGVYLIFFFRCLDSVLSRPRKMLGGIRTRAGPIQRDGQGLLGFIGEFGKLLFSLHFNAALDAFVLYFQSTGRFPTCTSPGLLRLPLVARWSAQSFVIIHVFKVVAVPGK